jgi:hypothetical protein
MAESPTSQALPQLSPELLEQYFIIRPSQRWKEIQDARTRLQELKQDKPYENMEADRDRVVTYRDVLQRSGRTIALAICLAAHLRRFSAQPAGKFSDALAVVSSGLDLQSLDETTKLTELERCIREVVTADNLPVLEIPLEGGAASWRAALEQWLAVVNKTPAHEMREVRRDAWTTWDSRLLAFVQGRADEWPPDINYLRCRAEGSAPGTILPARLGRLTLPQMTDALTAALTPVSTVDDAKECPATFSLALLLALRFDLVSELGDPLDTVVQSFLQGRGVSRTSGTSPSIKGVLIIRTPAGSRTTPWNINPSVPALVTTLQNCPMLFTGKSDLGRYLAPRLTGVLFEVDRTENVRDAARRYLNEFKKLLERFPNSQSIRGGLLLARPVGDMNALPPELRAVAVAPSDVAEAVRLAFGS